MCGITGFFDATQSMSISTMAAVVQDMVQRLVHRGPDHSGMWLDAQAGIALGHRRLAILDVSPEGHQPMVSKNDRYVIVFNGEIYNFAALKQELERLGHRFRGHSDTEVMLASFCEWGVQQAIARMNGMFAFALWDRRESILHLGRDRLGEKPLYYGWLGQTLIFGSELKALQAYPHFQADINRDALAAFLRYSYVPAPDSIYQNIYKLPPGTILSWQGEATHPTPIAYWSAQAIAEAGTQHPFTGSEADAIAQLEALLRDAIALRMVADVPLGSFISGGVDSSTVVALMQAQSRQAVKTFTIGFYEEAYNEAHYAKAVAQHLGTDHTELYVTPAEALAVIPNLPTLYDEPFSDPSQVPTFLVSELARQQVTVCLSGDGGDELFGGYKRYFVGRRIWQKLGWLPVQIRQMMAGAITTRSPQAWDETFARLQPYLPAQLQYPTIGDDLHKLAGVLAAANPDAMYAQLASHWQEEALVIGATLPSSIRNPPVAQLSDFTQRMMFLDLVTYLPDDILAKVDRASMGVSLEARVPLLDHRVVEFAWQLPLAMKIRGGQGKWLLRQVLYKYVPPALIERPKSGFGIPIDRWLREPLRDWAEALLDEQRLRREGFLNPVPIRKKWAEHLSGDRNWQYYLWDVLMFQAWLEQSRCALSVPTCA
jgi:asparagine synthase (glutamine-hydrolysing)